MTAIERIRFLPLALLGRAVAALTRSVEVEHATPEATFVLASGAVARFLSSAGFIAITIGSTVFLSARGVPRPYLVRHELAHVEQGRRWGIVFPFAYLAGWVWAFLETGDSRLAYWRNPFERAARAAEAALPGHDEDT